MEEGYGGPVWHASASSPGGRAVAWALAERALAGVGDPSLGEWRELGPRAVHLRRRVSGAERKAAGNLTVRDIRGTREERQRLDRLRRDGVRLAG